MHGATAMSDERIRVALLGMSGRSLALLKMFFDGAGRHHFEVVEERHAKAGVFDLDTPGAEKLWNVYYKLYDWPSIVLSVRERHLPNAIWVRKPVLVESLAEAATRLDHLMTGGVRRAAASPTTAERARVRPVASRPAGQPSTAGHTGTRHTTASGPAGAARPAAAGSDGTRTAPDTILSSWARLRELSASLRAGRSIDSSVAASAAADAPTEVPAPAPRPAQDIRQVARGGDQKPAKKVDKDPAKKIARKVAKKAAAPGSFCRENLREASPGIRQYVGAEDDLDPNNAGHRERMFYAVRGHFQAALDAAWRKACDSQRRVLVHALDEKFVLFCPHTGLVTTNFGRRTLRSTCVMALSRGDLRAELLGANSPTPDDSDAVTVNADTLLWNVALWTSKGRLPQGVDLYARVHLRHWPNFTRLTRTPHAMRIAALWAERGVSLAETPGLLGIPQRYVFAVYSAAHALGLLRLEAAQEAERRGDAGDDRSGESAPMSIEKHRQRGLFSRLLRRFTG